MQKLVNLHQSFLNQRATPFEGLCVLVSDRLHIKDKSKVEKTVSHTDAHLFPKRRLLHISVSRGVAEVFRNGFFFSRWTWVSLFEYSMWRPPKWRLSTNRSALWPWI